MGWLNSITNGVLFLHLEQREASSKDTATRIRWEEEEAIVSSVLFLFWRWRQAMSAMLSGSVEMALVIVSFRVGMDHAVHCLNI